jgi:hypothetical protein
MNACDFLLECVKRKNIMGPWMVEKERSILGPIVIGIPQQEQGM